MGNPHGHRQLNWGKVGRIRRCAPNLLYQLLAHCRAKWARLTSMGEDFLLVLVFLIAEEITCKSPPFYSPHPPHTLYHHPKGKGEKSHVD